MSNRNIALLSPSQNAYSETFIQAHKNQLEGKIFYYFGGLEQLQLEGFGSLKKIRKSFWLRLQRKLQNKRYSWYYFQLLKSSFQKNKIEVVMVEYGTTAQIYLPLLQEMKLPFIVHFHGYDASIKQVLEKNNYYKEIFQTANFVVVVSKKMYRDFLSYGCPEEKLIYNVYGPDDSFLKVQPKFSKQQLIGIGRFVNKKAPYYTLLAFREVVRKFPQARLVLAGNGELLESCKNLAKHYNIENQVFFPGIISPEKYRGYLRESLSFVQHSVMAINGDSEGTPVALLEASAAGLPIISTNHAGIPDVIEHGKTGLLAEEHDVTGMAQNMIRLLENPELAKELGRNGKRHIKKNFTLKRHIAVLDEMIEKQ